MSNKKITRRWFLIISALATAGMALFKYAPKVTTLHVIKDFHPIMEHPYTWKIQAEVYDLCHDLIEERDLSMIFIEAPYGEYLVHFFPPGVERKKENLTLAFPRQDWNRTYSEHVWNNMTTKAKANLMGLWNTQMRNGVYPFGEPHKGFERGIPTAWMSLEFVGQDDIHVNGIEDPELLGEAVNIALELQKYEKEGDANNRNTDETRRLYREVNIERHPIEAGNIRKDYDQYGLTEAILIIGGMHVDGTFGKECLTEYLRERGLNLNVIEPPSYQGVLDRYISDSGRDQSNRIFPYQIEPVRRIPVPVDFCQESRFYTRREMMELRFQSCL